MAGILKKHEVTALHLQNFLMAGLVPLSLSRNIQKGIEYWRQKSLLPKVFFEQRHHKILSYQKIRLISMLQKNFVEMERLPRHFSLNRKRSEEHTSELQSRQYLVC